MFPRWLKLLSYASGALAAYHRWRNRHTLTVVMLHRVLPATDPRAAGSDPDFTLDPSLLQACLAFFRRHYHPVSLDEVLEARRGRARLPERALLLSFDDGWADNVEHAWPLLKAAGVPAVLFVAGDAIDRPSAFFQERLLSAWRRGALDARRAAGALADAGAAPDADAGPADVRHFIRRVEDLDDVRRERLLGLLSDALADPHRQMVTTAELTRARDFGVAVGTHGLTHAPLTRVPDPEREIAGARRRVADALAPLPPPAAMSFPHGQFDGRTVAASRAAGHELMFSSEPVINAVRPGLAARLGRVALETASMCSPRGQFCPATLALALFRRPRLRLA